MGFDPCPVSYDNSYLRTSLFIQDSGYILPSLSQPLKRYSSSSPIVRTGSVAVLITLLPITTITNYQLSILHNIYYGHL